MTWLLYIANAALARTESALGKYSGRRGGNPHTFNLGKTVAAAVLCARLALIVGFDNTLTNMRIARAETGVKLIGSGNFLRNVHPLFIYRGECDYLDSCGFDDQSYGCWYDFCYSDNFAVGFKMQEKTMSVYQTCFCFWYSAWGDTEVGFKSDGKMNSIISKSKVSLRDDVSYGAYLEALPEGGGRIDQPLFKLAHNKNDSYKEYLTDEVIWAKR